jgi:hypothetical protein
MVQLKPRNALLASDRQREERYSSAAVAAKSQIIAPQTASEKIGKRATNDIARSFHSQKLRRRPLLRTSVIQSKAFVLPAKWSLV